MDRPKLLPSEYAWRPIHYLGSKLRVVDTISLILNQIDPKGGRLCDLFAGSGTVSAAIGIERAVTAVDIQEYSRVLCSALLTPPSASEIGLSHIQGTAINGRLYRDLAWAVAPLIEHEEQSIEDARNGRHEPILNLIELGAIATRGAKDGGSERLRQAFSTAEKRLTQIGHTTGPKAVVVRHFGGLYFAYSQTVALASLLDAAASQSETIRQTALAAVLSTASEIVNTVGKQFAQPIRPRDSTGKLKTHLIQKIIKDRTANTFETFSRWLSRYTEIPHSTKRHKIIRADYRDALSAHCSDVSIFYADPPYTRDHYSRFYHVLETMCIRDDPQIASTHPSSKGAGRGAYRTDRHQSPFCIKSQAPEAFRQLFKGVHELGVPLLLSYSPLARTTKPRPRVIEIPELQKIAAKYFGRVEFVPAGRVSHNKLNKSSLNSEVSHEAELFLVCS